MKFVKTFILVITVQFVHAQVNCETTPDQLGPYFYGGAPQILNDTLSPGITDSSRALKLTFYVMHDCDTIGPAILGGTYSLQLWHADNSGIYSHPTGGSTNYSYRGELELAGDSTVLYTTLPGIYPNRPSHIHVKGYLTNAPDFIDTLITQLYFEGDSLIANDPAANMSERWIRLDTLQGGGYRGAFAFGLTNLLGRNELVQDEKLIMVPNPNHGAFSLSTSESGLFQVFDSMGRMVYSKNISLGQHQIDLPLLNAGVYFASLNRNSVRFCIE